MKPEAGLSRWAIEDTGVTEEPPMTHLVPIVINLRPCTLNGQQKFQQPAAVRQNQEIVSKLIPSTARQEHRLNAAAVNMPGFCMGGIGSLLVADQTIPAFKLYENTSQTIQ